MSDKITKVLQTFPPDWQRKLDLYLMSPYFQVSDSVQNLLHYYLDSARKVDKKNKSDEKLFAYLFPNMEFDISRIHRLKSETLEVLKVFIIQQRVNMESAHHVELLLSYYLENNLTNLFTFTYKQIVKKMESSPVNVGTTFYEDLSIRQTLTAFLSSHNPLKNTKSIVFFNESLADVHEKTEIFYYIRKLENASLILNMYKINELENREEEIRSLLNTLEQKPYIKEQPIVKIYYCICKLMLNPEETQLFDTLIALIKCFKGSIELVNLQVIYSHLRNYCARKINAGKTEFEVKLFEIYEEMIQSKKIYDYTGQLLPDKFINILTIGLRINKLSWLTDFIEEQKPYLREEYRESLTQYGLALIAFKEKSYGNVLKCLSKVEHLDALLDLRSKTLQLQSYYELKDTALESQSETFRLFLIRQKMTASNKIVAYKNFNKLLMNLYLLDFPTEEKLDKLKSKIEKTSPLAEKKWLLEKVAEKQTRI